MKAAGKKVHTDANIKLDLKVKFCYCQMKSYDYDNNIISELEFDSKLDNIDRMKEQVAFSEFLPLESRLE